MDSTISLCFGHCNLCRSSDGTAVATKESNFWQRASGPEPGGKGFRSCIRRRFALPGENSLYIPTNRFGNIDVRTFQNYTVEYGCSKWRKDLLAPPSPRLPGRTFAFWPWSHASRRWSILSFFRGSTSIAERCKGIDRCLRWTACSWLLQFFRLFLHRVRRPWWIWALRIPWHYSAHRVHFSWCCSHWSTCIWDADLKAR